MARTSLAGARADVATALNAVTGVTTAYDHEPTTHGKPVALTVSSAGIAPTDYLIAVRIYVTTETPVEEAQATMDAVVEAADNALPSWAGPSNWSIEWDQEEGQLVATCILEVGREDGF